MNEKILFGIIGFTLFSVYGLLFLGSFAVADYCYDNTTLITPIQINGADINVTNYCQYGCDNLLNICKPDNLTLYAIVFVLFIALIFLINQLKRLSK